MIERTTKLPSLAILNWAVLLGALAALFAFAATYARHKEDSVMRLTLFANSALPAGGLRACLVRRVLLTKGDWRAAPRDALRQQSWNSARTIEADVIDHRSARRLEIFTPGGKPLGDAQSEAVKTCLRGG